MSAPGLVVLKFGSSVLRSEADLSRVANEIKRHVDEGYRVVAVVSAIGNSTEELIRRARGLGYPQGDELSATRATVVNGTPIGAGFPGGSAVPAEAAFAALLATGEATSAALVGLALDSVGVAVLPGFVGRDGEGHHSLLGRGGSDLTALFVARSLGADRCRLLKEVGACGGNEGTCIGAGATVLAPTGRSSGAAQPRVSAVAIAAAATGEVAS